MRTIHRELDDIDVEISKLYKYREENEKNWKRATFVLFIGMALLFGGSVTLLMPFGDEPRLSLTPYHFLVLIGALLVWYGLTSLRGELVCRRELEICELARLLKQAETDKKILLNVGLRFNELNVKVADPLQEGFREKTLGVTYWGRLYLK